MNADTKKHIETTMNLLSQNPCGSVPQDRIPRAAAELKAALEEKPCIWKVFGISYWCDCGFSIGTFNGRDYKYCPQCGSGPIQHE